MSDLRQQLISALDPLDGAPRRARFSDFDLNPDAPRLDRPLRPAAVLIPIVDHADGPTLLLTRRSDSLASHTGQIAFPGGRLDPGETVVQAALREAVEEVGLSPDHVEPLGLSDAYETVTGFLVTPVVAWVRPGFTLTTDPREVADAFETPWDFLMDEANHRREFYDAPDGTRRWFWAMPWGERYIWGATAGMLRSLWGRLHNPAREEVA
ncbi:MAG: 8-oxo-dGTP pyrophosphatase MutT (NUDIX family) [Brevundimonas sp.]|jgi:8-oxo-dGTP pyrophosphatase MutT (NUDIX family)|uniref:NUDIX hydrolase n=1 Tax=Brevundimonas sp. TaxID=1871086 RepID=UPI0039E386EF